MSRKICAICGKPRSHATIQANPSNPDLHRLFPYLDQANVGSARIAQIHVHSRCLDMRPDISARVAIQGSGKITRKGGSRSWKRNG